jgi:hypothetical protein
LHPVELFKILLLPGKYFFFLGSQRSSILRANEKTTEDKKVEAIQAVENTASEIEEEEITEEAAEEKERTEHKE